MNATTVAVEEAEVPTRSQRRHPKTFTEMLVSSVIGLVASLVLSIDAVALAANPNADLSCNINAALSCGKVGLSWQASLLGFPNAFLGLIAEPVVITIAVAALGGVRFPRWFMNSAQVVYLIGFLFAFWLFYQAYFVIGALCPWCLLITITTTTVFVSMLRVNILDNNLGLPPGLHATLSSWLRAGADTLGVIIIFAVLAGMIFVKYGSVIFGG
jgi:uncharacterized membrane protein